jgi:hypothetical protein
VPKGQGLFLFRCTLDSSVRPIEPTNIREPLFSLSLSRLQPLLWICAASSFAFGRGQRNFFEHVFLFHGFVSGPAYDCVTENRELSG